MIENEDRHDADGKAYIAYFLTEPMMHFIWSGDHGDPVQVTRGESGEAVTETFLVPPAALKAEWYKACEAIVEAGLQANADDPIAAAYRDASDAVNHANRRWESNAVGVLREFRLACDLYAATTCDGCDQDPWRKPKHYGTCPLAPKVPDAVLAEAEVAYDRMDQDWFNRQSTEHLTAMWAIACDINQGACWDDEVYDALYVRGYFNEEAPTCPTP